MPPVLDTSWLAEVAGDKLGSGDERCQPGVPPPLDTSWLAEVAGDKLGSGNERCLPIVLSAGLWDGSHW